MNMELKEFLDLKQPKISDFLKLKRPEEFDFKDLMGEYYRHWAENHNGDPEYQILLDRLPEMVTENSIKKWFLYKTLDTDLNKRILRFDCDSWNGTSELTDAIYRRLWSAAPIKAKTRLGGDTMNSFAYMFNYFSDRKSFRESYKRYESEESFRREANRVLGMLAQSSGCLGNFTLIPAGFNRYRGSCLGDFFDLSLMELQANEVQWFGKENGGVFPQYINTFFLWDYTELEGKKYRILPFFEGHTKEQLFPVDRDEQLSVCIDTINNIIRRRGKFMVDMLHIAVNRPEQYKKIQAYLSELDTLFPSLEEAAKTIREKFS